MNFGLGSSILKLLSCENKSLLVWWNSFLILDLGLDIIDDVVLFNIKSDCLSSQSLDGDLHSSASIDLPAEKKYLSRRWKNTRLQAKSSEELQLSVSESTNSKLIAIPLTNQGEPLSSLIAFILFYFKVRRNSCITIF